MTPRAALPLLLSLPLLLAAANGRADVETESAPKLHFDPFERPELLARPAPARVEVEPPPPPPWQPGLRAVMVSGGSSVANVDGQLVAIGEEIDGHRLLEVTERRAVFEKDGTLYELVMQ